MCRLCEWVRPRHVYRLREYDVPRRPTGDTAEHKSTGDTAEHESTGDTAEVATFADAPLKAKAAGVTPLVEEEESARAGLYGNGFSYAHRSAHGVTKNFDPFDITLKKAQILFLSRLVILYSHFLGRSYTFPPESRPVRSTPRKK